MNVLYNNTIIAFFAMKFEIFEKRNKTKQSFS